MKKTYLKLLVASVLLVGGTSFITSCSDNDKDSPEVVIGVKDLPSEAQSFLNTYFPNINASKIEQQSISDITMYEVELANGYEVEFDSQGVWQEVSAPDNMTIPSGIAPENIEEYVNTNYSDYGINEINKTGAGYNVEVNGGVRLTFNQLGECTGTYQDL